MEIKKRIKRSSSAQQAVAVYIVQNHWLTRKEVAFNLKINYQTVSKIYRERVKVNKVLSLRYPTPPDVK